MCKHIHLVRYTDRDVLLIFTYKNIYCQAHLLPVTLYHLNPAHLKKKSDFILPDSQQWWCPFLSPLRLLCARCRWYHPDRTCKRIMGILTPSCTGETAWLSPHWFSYSDEILELLCFSTLTYTYILKLYMELHQMWWVLLCVTYRPSIKFQSNCFCSVCVILLTVR